MALPDGDLLRQGDRMEISPPPHRSRLVRHLAIVLVLKVIVLAVLWHAFIKPNRVAVDAGAMGARIAGQDSQHQQENSHDRFDGR